LDSQPVGVLLALGSLTTVSQIDNFFIVLIFFRNLFTVLEEQSSSSSSSSSEEEDPEKIRQRKRPLFSPSKYYI
jgi:hypothetical protein